MQKASILILGFFVALQVPNEKPSGDWLDAPLQVNVSLTELPADRSEVNPRCDAERRAAQSVAERVLVSKGWKLGKSTRGSGSVGGIEIVQAFLQYDGMCRP